MHQNLKSTPSLEQASAIGNPSTTRTAPIELDLSQLNDVSGGSPKGTWEAMSTIVESPKGTW